MRSSYTASLAHRPMSEAPSYVKVRYPVTNVVADDGRSEVIRLGGSRNTEQVIAAQSFSQSNLLWNFQPPSPQTIVTRDWRIRLYVEVAPLAPAATLGANSDCLSSWPLNSITQNMQLSINGASTSVQLYNLAPALLAMGTTPENRRTAFASTAAQPDLFQTFPEGTGLVAEPFAGYGNNVVENSRGSFPYIAGVAPGSRRYVITEPLLVSPLLTGDRQDEGFVNVNQLQLIVQFIGSQQPFWSHNSDVAAGGDPAYVGVSLTFYQAPELLLTYITPSPTFMVPPMQTLEYYQPVISTQQAATLAPGAAVASFACQAQQLNQVPKRMLVFIRHLNPTSLQTQSWCRIDNFNLNFANVAGLFASASTQQLWQMSQRNGSNISWVEWNGYRGSVLAIDFGRDIGLEADLAPGTQGLFQIQPQVSFTNVSSQPFTPEINVVYILQGNVTVVPNACRFTLGNLTRETVLQVAQFGQEIPHEMHSILDSGGSFWSSLKSFVKKAVHGIGKAAKVASALAPGLAMINPALGATVGSIASSVDRFSPGIEHALGAGMAGGRMAGGRLRRVAAMR